MSADLASERFYRSRVRKLIAAAYVSNPGPSKVAVALLGRRALSPPDRVTQRCASQALL
jgi:hypothetical protein